MLKALVYSDLQYKYCSIEFSYMSSVSVPDPCFLYLACVVHHDIRHCYVYRDELSCRTALCIFDMELLTRL